MNWMRFHVSATDAAMARASDVLPTPGHVLDEQVAFGQDAADRGPHHLVFAVHDPGDVGDQLVEALDKADHLGTGGRPGSFL